MAYSLSRQHRLYLQNEASFGVIPNTTGTATVAGSNACKFQKAQFSPNVATLVPPDKTGTRTVPRGAPGRRNSSWEIGGSLIPNGVAGVVPDFDPLFRSSFGQAPVISAGTSVAYNLSDSVLSFTAFGFRKPASVRQAVAFGCVVDKVEFSIGQDIASFTANGSCLWVADSVNFSGLDSVGKGGLTAFPTEPASPVTNGTIIPGFTGQATFDGNVMATIASAKVSLGISNSLETAFGQFYSTIPGGDVRNIGIEFDLYDDDSTGASNLYTKALSKAAINISLQIGTVAGSIVTLNLNGVQLAAPTLDDGQRRWVAKFGASRATGSSASGSTADEVSLIFS